MLEQKTYAQDPGKLIAGGLPEGADALIFTQAARKRGGRNVFIARDDSRAASFMAAVKFFAADIPIIHCPAWDCLPFDRVSPSRTVAAARAAALYALTDHMGDMPVIIVTTVNAAQQKVPPREVISKSGFRAKPGEDVIRDALQSYLVNNGYSRAAMVGEPGDFAVRGGIVDIFPPDRDEPIRMDFFGDELETLRSFDPDSQRTTGNVDSLYLSPVSEVFLTEERIASFRKGYIAAFGGGVSQDPLYAAVSDGIRAAGVEHALPLFYDELESLFDYFGYDALIALDGQVEQARAERDTLIEDYYEARKSYADAQGGATHRALPAEQLYLLGEAWLQQLRGRPLREHTPFEREAAPGIINFGGKLGRNFNAERQREGVNVFDAASAHIQELTKSGQKVWVASWTEGSAERLGSVLGDHDVDIPLLSNGLAARELAPGKAARIVLPLEQGFTLGKLSVMSEQDILGDRLVNRSKKRKAKNFISDATALQPGDLVIHIDHGLGRYLGLKTLSVQDAPHDCLELEYNKGAKLFLPVENIELLSRYGSAPDAVMLDTLGGVAWQSRKAKAKERLQEMAGQLIEIAAKRAMKQAEPVTPPDGLYDEFCARFPYSETDDQLSAIEDVTKDLASGRPMDRLICGDVGFGKTEVALRAAFIMAMSGRQVAVVAPTTVLARQHFKTFADRFRDWPIKIRQLSRLVSTKDANEAREMLKTGQCDIIVGTHAVLSKQVGFANLGMVIVDEEQRFGVQHKERLKALRADVHMLTLTATPIPRTLQMALSGIRDLSLIATPPVDRLAVRTYITPWDPVGLREAILRERYRGGQSFFVVPRISDLKFCQEFLETQVPEVKFVVAHGQMAGGLLEDVMTAFYDGQYDVLLSTSIIESGIDIPTANTMIIYRSDRFGLAQLYQMRGRVGRSKIRAYAYMSVPDTHKMTAGAEQRLKVLQSLDSLGAGFSLASHDLDMRGGGNPLGEEQSGHIKDLGVELYQHMLEEAVASLKDDMETRDESWSPSVNLGISVLIPESYVSDLNVRLSLYRRAADIENDEDSESFAAELIDRFGKLPREAEHFLKVMQIKRLCRQAHVEKVDAGPRGAVLTIRHKDVTDTDHIIQCLQTQLNWKLRPDQTIFVKADMEDESKRITGVIRALKTLVSDKG